MYKFVLLPKAEEAFAQADAPLARKLARAFKLLEVDPLRHRNIKRLTGSLKGVFRLRAGDYRIIYRIDAKKKTVYVVEKVQYTEKDHRVWINKTQYFGGVPKAVWEFHVGGYQVCHKWLKDRKGRKLAYEDTQHYQKIVVALNESIRLMAEIDEVIGQHGGWPMGYSGEARA